jgi:putative membrane protein
MKHTFRLLPGLILTGALFIASCQGSSSTDDSKDIAEAKNDTTLDTKAAEKDAQFVVDVAAANYAEIEFAKVAIKRSSNKEIKDIANMLESDHKMFITQLKDYAGQHNISTPDSATADAQKSAWDLADNNKGSDFDKKWCSELLDKHEKTISKLESASNEVADPALKTWIADALPKIRSHRDKLIECKDKMK